jgi:hypothetical protein
VGKGCLKEGKRRKWGIKWSIQAGKVAGKIPGNYRGVDREYDRELKINGRKIPVKWGKMGGNDFWRVSEESMKVVKDKWMRQKYLMPGLGRGI